MSALPDPEALLDSLSEDLQAALEARAITDPVLVGILTGGLWVAEHLSKRIGSVAPVGALDIGFHRDDFAARGIPTTIQPSRLTGIVEGRHVVLIDDVLHSGRTVRAAINALFEYGRPASILLAVLVDRPGRQLPIKADVCGTHLDLPAQQRLQLNGPEPLSFSLRGNDDV